MSLVRNILTNNVRLTAQTWSNSSAAYAGSLMSSGQVGSPASTPRRLAFHTNLLLRDNRMDRSCLEARATWSKSSGCKREAIYAIELR